MYSPVAIPFTTMAAASMPALVARALGAGISDTATFTTRPTTTALLMVPNPGRCRSGIHAASTTKLTTMTTQPIRTPSSRAIP